MLPFRRQRSLPRRITDALTKSSARRKPALRSAAAALDQKWARTWLAGVARESFLHFVLNPIMGYYARRRATGREKLAAVKGPVILVANHASHLDTPVILSALPRSLRKRTAVAAAADYFYRNRLVASLVSLIFNTVPIERKGGGGLSKDGSHLDKLLDQGWNLLLYPEGTRSRAGGAPGRVRRGAAVLAAAHHLAIVPIRVSGTAEAMPPGRMWPKRLHGKLGVSTRHPIEVSFGDPIQPSEDTAALIERVQTFFENGNGRPSVSPYRRASRKGSSGARAG